MKAVGFRSRTALIACLIVLLACVVLSCSEKEKETPENRDYNRALLQSQEEFNVQTLVTVGIVASLVVGFVFFFSAGSIVFLFHTHRNYLKREFDAHKTELEQRIHQQLETQRQEKYNYLAYMSFATTGRELLTEYLISSKTDRAKATWAFPEFVRALNHLLSVDQGSAVLRMFYLNCLRSIKACSELPLSSMSQIHVQNARTYLRRLMNQETWKEDAEISDEVRQIEKWLEPPGQTQQAVEE
jgi:hypothetical protein